MDATNRERTVAVDEYGKAYPAVHNERVPSGAPASLRRATQRVTSIDFVRGLAMIFMALDHTRDFFTNVRFDPEDIRLTYSSLFLARWITHFCAPAFFLLAGIGAALFGRRTSPSELRRFLVSRGLWLIFLEFTVVGFAWTFTPGWGMFGVIWCLGVSLICLAAFVSAPRWMTAALAVMMICLHDVFDSVNPSLFGTHQWLMFMLHRTGTTGIGPLKFFVLFPLIPWVAVTMLGFSVSSWFWESSLDRTRLLISAGVGCTTFFIVLRFTNLYGNPAADIAHSSPGNWLIQPTAIQSLILFLDVEKYPPSLQYLLMTLGPIFMALASAPTLLTSAFGRVVEVYGRTPLFFYIVHLYLIHLLALFLSLLTRQPAAWLLHGGFFLNRIPDAYGFNLPIVCALWIAIVIALFYPCRWFANLKSAHPDSLLRFL